MVAQEAGGTWLRILGELSESIRTGEPQSRRVFGMRWWDWLNANSKELANFGEAMKANKLKPASEVLGCRKDVIAGRRESLSASPQVFYYAAVDFDIPSSRRARRRHRRWRQQVARIIQRKLVQDGRRR